MKQHWLNVLCKCLLGPSKKRISPMNCLVRFSRRQRMEAEYEDIITWLYLHRYRSRDTDTWWCTTLCFLGRWEDCIVFLQICRNMMQSSQQTRGIQPILFKCWANEGDAGQHWNSIGWMPCVALCLLGGVTGLRPNARAVHTSTLLVGVQCQLQLMSRSLVTREVTELT